MARCLALALALAALAATALGGFPNIYPCPGPKGPQGAGANCKEVKLPGNLCSVCPLRPPTGDGKFKDCSNIYNTFGGQCMNAMNQYVAANPCDNKRKQVMGTLNKNPNDWRARMDMDYFLYSVCEQCCDCIPIGASPKKNFGAWVTYRGNCPAHAWYDVCAVLPHFTHFVKIGEPTPPQFNNPPKACNMLSQWSSSGESHNWAKNPKTKLSTALSNALSSMLNSISCSSKGIWDKCYDLESKQQNLGVPGQFTGQGTKGKTISITPNVVVQQPAKTPTQTQNQNQNQNTKTNTDLSGGKEAIGPCNCSGKKNWGCTLFVASQKKCVKFGEKCFPADGSQSYAMDKCVGGGSSSGGNTPTKPAPKPAAPKLTVQKTSSGACKCDGEIKVGCTYWNPSAKKCESNGPKCFPKDGSQSYGIDKCVSGGGGGSKQQPQQPKASAQQPAKKTGCNCTGKVDYGCTYWDPKLKKCTSHGQKCFPADGSLGYAVSC